MDKEDIDYGEITGDNPRNRILAAAEELIAASGVEAATTRAVAAAAGVQAPTLYRMFGDKDGLLDAVAEHAMAAYVTGKGTRKPDPDPIEEMRNGWDAHVSFGLQHSGIFMIMAARPAPAYNSHAMQQGMELLREKIRALAAIGRLRIPENRALDLMHSAGTGIILTLLRKPPAERDMTLSYEAREAVISALTGDPVPDADNGASGAAMALRVRLPELDRLTPGEKLLISELLDRIASDR